MESRRSLLKMLVLGGTFSTFASSAFGWTRKASDRPTDSLPRTIDEAWRTLAAMAAAKSTIFGWQLESVSPVTDHAFVMTLRNSAGTAARVRLGGNSGHPKGLVHTPEFDFVLLNEGGGHTPTDESLAQALRQLAKILSGETSGTSPRPSFLSEA